MPDFSASAAAELLPDVLELSLTPLALLRPEYGVAGEVQDFRLEHLNAAGQQVLQLPEQPVSLWSTCFPASSRAAVLEFCQQVLATGQPGQHNAQCGPQGQMQEYRLTARRRQEWLIVSFTDVAAAAGPPAPPQPMPAGSGQPWQQEQLLQAPLCVACLEGPELVFTLVNPLYQQLVGSRPLLGLPLRQAWPELEGQPFFKLLEGVWQTGDTVYGNEQVAYLDRTNSGRLEPVFFNFIYQAMRDAAGGIRGVTIFAYDVTEQVATRQQVQLLNEELAAANEELRVTNEELLAGNAALQYSQQQVQQLNQALEARVAARTRQVQAAQAQAEHQRARLEQLFMEAPAAICILTGPELVFELVNPAYEQLFPARTLQGQPILAVLPEVAQHPVYRTLREVYRTGLAHEERSMRIPLARPTDGVLEDRYFDYVQQPHANEHGQLTGVVVFAFEVTAQVQARHASEAAARRLRLITDSLPILISYVDQEQRYQFVNQAYETWLGYPPAQMQGQQVRTFIGEPAYAAVEGYITRALAGERVDFEARMPYPGGVVRHIRTTYMPDVQDGIVAGFYAMVLDITAQVEAQREAEQQRTLLHTLFMEAPAPIVILEGPQYVFQLVNPAYQRIFPGRELLGKPMLAALPEVVDTPMPGILAQVYQTGEPYVAQELLLQLARYEGGPREDIYWTFTYQARRNTQGAVDGILVFAHEVTDQVQARRVVEEREQYVRQMADNVPTIIWVTDPAGRCTYLNQQWFDYTRQNRAEALGAGWLSHVHPDDVASAQATFMEASRQQSPFSLLYRLLRHDGEYHWAIDTGLPRFSAQNEFEGHIGTVVDIHERKQAEEALQKLTQKLQATNEQLTRTNVDLDNFIYTASHDLKAPITNIEGLLQAVRAHLPPDEAVTQPLLPLLGMMQESVARFQRTIEHLSDVTKLQKEYDQPTTLIALPPVVEDVYLDLQPLIQETGAQVEIDVEPSPRISFSVKNLRSVVYNLLSNALRYRHPERVPRVRISAQEQQQFVVLTVEDNGLGLTASQQAELFTMFRRFHSHVEGSGIGLYMVKRSVENAGGRIEVRSELNQGSTFSVYFRR